MSNKPSSTKKIHGIVVTDEEWREAQVEILKGRFIILPTDILLDKQAGKLTTQDIYFYCYLLAKQGRNESLYWGYDSLELFTGISTSVLKESVERLLASGHIKRKRQRDGPSHTYCLTRVSNDRKVFVRGVKVAEATTQIAYQRAPTALVKSPFERPSSVQVDSNLN
jgi:hypothetical protein